MDRPIRLRVQRTAPGDWRAVLHLDGVRTSAVHVGTFPTWSDAITEGCVAGRLQAAGISWTAPGAPEPVAAAEEQWQELVVLPADAIGQALPEVPASMYAEDAVELEVALDEPLTFGQHRELSPDVRAYLDSISLGREQ